MEKGEVSNRRPLKTRSSRIARTIAAAIARTPITPNQISVISIAFAILGAISLLCFPGPAGLMVCAVAIQLRLACNLLDGMVAVEGGKRSVLGSIYNEVPDRIADSLFIVALGYSVNLPALGWFAALVAAMTAYIRVLGGSLGLPQDFRGPMAKPQRMAAMTAACVIGAIEHASMQTQHALRIALIVIAVGAVVTCVTRIRAMAAQLQQI